jgi:hypothetical protein
MATRKTYINSDEELVIKGALTIEGNVTQIETTETINRLETDQFIINSDGDATTAALTLNGTSSDQATMSYNSTNGIIQFNKNITATNFTGNVIGQSASAEKFTSAVTVALTGDVTGSATFIGAGNTASIATTIQQNSVALGTDTTGDYLAGLTGGNGLTVVGSGSEGATPVVNMDATGVTAASYGSASAVSTFTVNGLGQLTTAATTPIQIATSQITSLESVVEAYFSANDTGGDGSLSYSNGVFTYTGPSASEVRAHFTPGTGIGISGGTISTNDGAIVHDNLSGFVANEHVDHSTVTLTAGDGLTGGNGDLTSSQTFSVDNSVIRTTGSQTISGNKTFSGNQTFTGDVDLSGAGDVSGFTVDGDLVVTGTMTVTTVNATTETNSVITASSLTLREGAGTGIDSHIYVERGVTGNNAYLKWNESLDRWQFNNGSSDNNMLLLSDITGGAGLTFGSGDIAVGQGYGITVNADTIETNNSQVRALFSISNASGDGALAYNSGTGVITYTGPSASEVRAHLSVGTNTGDGDFTYNNATGQMHYAGPTSSVYRTALQSGDGIDYIQGNGNIRVDSTVVRTSGNQTISGTKTFNGALSVPGTASTTANAIYTESGEAFIYVGGQAKKITPTASVGTVASVGSGDINLYAGKTTVANVDTHGVKSISNGAYATLSEGSNVVTVDANISAIRKAFDGTGSINYDEATGVFSFTDADRTDATIRGLFTAGGSLSYDSNLGNFSFTERTDSEVRSLFSGGNLINIAGNGTIDTTADNYSSWNFNTDTNSAAGIGSGQTLTFTGGTGIGVTHNVNTKTITITNTNSADITAVTAGNGLTGGGTQGTVSLAVGAGDLIDVNSTSVNVDLTELTDMTQTFVGGDEFVVLDNDYDVDGVTLNFGLQRRKRADEIGLSKFDNDAGFGTITGVTASTGLTGGGSTGSISLALATAGAGAGTYGSTDDNSKIDQITLDAYGRVTSISTGPSGDISRVNITAGDGLTGSADTTTGTHTQTLSVVQATSSAFGGVKVGYSENGKNYPVELDSGKMYVNVPWVDTNTDTNTTYTAGTGLSLSGTTFSASGLTLSELASGSYQTSSSFSTNGFYDTDGKILTSAAVNDLIESKGYGDISAVLTANGSGLDGGAGSGSVNLSIDLTDTNKFTSTNTVSKAVVRDTNGNFAAGTITATATQAQYADLAENYVADESYEPGTVLVIGGQHEVTVTEEAGSYKVVGVVSTDPAHLMNVDCEGEHVVAVALRGRVPCKVIGNVNKGDVLVASDTPGYAMVGALSHTLSPLQIVGRSLENKTDAMPGIVEIIV